MKRKLLSALIAVAVVFSTTISTIVTVSATKYTSLSITNVSKNTSNAVTSFNMQFSTTDTYQGNVILAIYQRTDPLSAPEDNTITTTQGYMFQKDVGILQNGAHAYAMDCSATPLTMGYDYYVGLWIYFGNKWHCDAVLQLSNKDLGIEMPPEATPAARIDYANKQLTGLAANAAYKINGKSFTSDGSGKIAISAGWFGTTLSIVKPGNGTTTKDSAAQSLAVAAVPTAPAAGQFTVTDAATNGGKGNIKQKTAGAQYEYFNGTAWVNLDQTKGIDLPAGTYKVRAAATATAPAGNEVSFTVKQPASTPAAGIDYVNKQLTGLEANTAYKINGKSFTSDGSGKIAIPAGWFGTALSIVKPGNGTTTTDSAAQSLAVAAVPTAPAAGQFIVTDAATNGGKGNIKQKTAGVQYEYFNGTSWVNIDQTKGIDLPAGDYKVRAAASATAPTGSEASFTVKQPAPTPAAGQFTVTNAATNGGKGNIKQTAAGVQCEYFNGTTWVKLDPTKGADLPAGTYKVRTAATGDELASAELSLLIKQPAATPDANQFAVTDVTTYGGKDGKITGVDATMEYSTDGGKSWVTVTGNEITGLTTGSVQLRKKEAGNDLPSAAITKYIKQPEVTPAPAVDYKTDELTGLVEGSDYAITVGNQAYIVTAGKGGKIALIGKDKDGKDYDLGGQAVSVVKKGNGTTTIDSAGKDVTVAARPAVPAEKPVVTGKTANTLTVAAEKGNEYSIDGGNTWVTAPQDKDKVVFDGLDKNKEYKVLVRIKATDEIPASLPNETITKTAKYDAEEVAKWFDKNSKTSHEGSGVDEKGENESVKIIVDENGNYKITLKKDIVGTVVIPDDAHNLTIDLNGHDIKGEDGTENDPNGKAAIEIVDGGDETNPTHLTFVDTSTGAEKGAVKGGNGFGKKGGNGGEGIKTTDEILPGVGIGIGEKVTVIGGNGGSSEAGTGGNGGSGITGQIDVCITGGLVSGGNGGNGGSSSGGNGKGGNGGTGISVDRDVEVEKGSVSGGNGGNGGSSKTDNGGEGGSGGAGIQTGTGTSISGGNVTGGSGGNGGTSEKGGGGNGGGGGTGVKGDVKIAGGSSSGGNGGKGGSSTNGNGGSGGNGGSTVIGTTTGENKGNGGNGGDGGSSKDGSGGSGGSGGTSTSGKGGNGGNGGSSKNSNGGNGGSGGSSTSGTGGNGGNGGSSENKNGGAGGNGGTSTSGKGGNGGNGGSSKNSNGGNGGNGGSSSSGNGGNAGKGGSSKNGNSGKRGSSKKPSLSGSNVTGVSKPGASDGKISGLDETMEYSLDGGKTWIPVKGTEITGLKAGKVMIRTKATDTKSASEAVTLTVSEPIPLTGDTNIYPYAALMLISGLGVFILMKRKKHTEK